MANTSNFMIIKILNFLFQNPLFRIHLLAFQVEAVLENELEEGLLKVNLTRWEGQMFKEIFQS